MLIDVTCCQYSPILHVRHNTSSAAACACTAVILQAFGGTSLSKCSGQSPGKEVSKILADCLGPPLKKPGSTGCADNSATLQKLSWSSDTACRSALPCLSLLALAEIGRPSYNASAVCPEIYHKIWLCCNFRKHHTEAIAGS